MELLVIKVRFLAVLAFVLALPLGAAAAEALHVVTYNIHSGLGPGFTFRRPKATVERNLRAVARAIEVTVPRGEKVDLVALNEVDFGSRRSGWIDEAAFLADELGRSTGERYEVVRGETWRRRVPGLEVRFGNAALVRRRVLRSAACLLEDGAVCQASRATSTSLPSLSAKRGWGRFLSETRGVVALTIDVAGRPVDVLVTHLDAFAQDEREAQAAHLLERFVDGSRTTILLGDMNAVPAPLARPLFETDRTAAILAGGALVDARAVYAAGIAETSTARWATFPSDRPRWPLDWVLGSPDLVPELVTTVGERESDHRGLYVRFRLG